jgi:WD40 repeat protein
MKRNNSVLISTIFVLAVLACQQLTPTSNINDNSHETQIPSTEIMSPTSPPVLGDIYASLASNIKISESPEMAKELMRLGKGEPSGKIVYSPDRQLLAVPSTVGIRLFNAITLEEVKFIDTNSLNYLVAFSSDSKKIVSVLVKDKTISNSDIDTGDLICENTLSHEGDWNNPALVKEIAFTSDGEFIVTKGLAGIYIFDSKTCNEIKFIESKVISLWFAISPDGKKLASSTDKEIVNIWEISTGKLLSILELNIGLDTNIISGVFSSDSQQLATSTDLGPFQTWDVATGKMLNNLGETTHRESYVRGYFNKDSLLLLEAGVQFELWDIPSKEKIYSSHLNLRGTSYSRSKYDMSFDYYSKDGKIYGTLLQYGEPVLSWDIATGSQIDALEWKSKDILGVVGYEDISFVSGRFVSGRDPVEIWDFNSDIYTLIQTIAPQDSVQHVVLSPDGNKIAISFLSKGTVEIWDVNSGQMEHTLEVNLDGSVGNFAFSPSNQELVASSFPKDIKLWDVNTGQLIKTITPNNGVTTKNDTSADDFAYSPDGTKLATRNLNDEIEIWDTGTGDLISTLQAGSWTFNLVFSSDGQYLASTKSIADQVTSKKPDDTKIKIWNVNAGNLVKTLENNLVITNICFSPDGKQLAVASEDEYLFPTTIVLWDLDSETVKQTLSGHTMRIYNLDYLSEGTILISSSVDGTIRIWGVP